jgi:CRISPR-associated protein Csx17
LSGIQDSTIGPLRTNLEPVDWKAGDRRWAERDRRVVWNSADLPANLIAVLQRRLMDGSRQGCAKLPLQSERPAALDAVAAFLAGKVDDRRLEELLWGLVAIDHRAFVKILFPPRQTESLPRSYALLKLLFLPDPPIAADQGSPLRLEPEILPLLSRGDAPAACQIAMRRLRAAGLQPIPHARAGRGNRDNQWLDVQMTVDTRRLAAALLFPVSTADARRLRNLVTRPNQESE